MNPTTLIKKLEQKIWNLEKDPSASCEVRSYGLWQVGSDSGQGKYIGFLFIIIFPKSHWATSLLFLAIGQTVILVGGLACKMRIFIFIHLWGIVRYCSLMMLGTWGRNRFSFLQKSSFIYTFTKWKGQDCSVISI